MAQVTTKKTRILLKTGTTSDWNTAATSENPFVPLLGEVCIYTDYDTDSEGNFIPGIKIGNGRNHIGELTFLREKYISDNEIDRLFI